VRFGKRLRRVPQLAQLLSPAGGDGTESLEGKPVCIR
jgi:hypothetical protein